MIWETGFVSAGRAELFIAAQQVMEMGGSAPPMAQDKYGRHIYTRLFDITGFNDLFAVSPNTVHSGHPEQFGQFRITLEIHLEAVSDQNTQQSR
jgi:hypothetical protein